MRRRKRSNKRKGKRAKRKKREGGCCVVFVCVLLCWLCVSMMEMKDGKSHSKLFSLPQIIQQLFILLYQQQQFLDEKMQPDLKIAPFCKKSWVLVFSVNVVHLSTPVITSFPRNIPSSTENHLLSTSFPFSNEFKMVSPYETV